MSQTLTQNQGPLSFNPALAIVTIVGFIIFIAILNRFVFKQIFIILDQRQRDITDIYDQLDADRKRMEDTRRQYEERLRGIEEDARERIQSAVKEAQQLRSELIAGAQQQADAIITQGRNDLERERQKSFLDMRQQIVALTVAAAGKLVGESLDDAHHTKLVDDFITNVGNGVVGRPGYSAPGGSSAAASEGL